MKALLIEPEEKRIAEIDIADMDAIKSVIGYATIESDAIGHGGDTLFFDEECFLRGSEGRFQIDTMIPVSGKGVVMGLEGESTLLDVGIDKEALAARLKYL
jgi:hypothetical protein